MRADQANTDYRNTSYDPAADPVQQTSDPQIGSSKARQPGPLADIPTRSRSASTATAAHSDHAAKQPAPTRPDTSIPSPSANVDEARSTDAASADEASAAPIDMGKLTKAASEVKLQFHVPMDEVKKAAALIQPDGVSRAVEDLGNSTQRALLEAARGPISPESIPSAPDSLAAIRAFRSLKSSLDQRIESLKDLYRLGRPNAANQPLSDASHQLAGLASKMADLLEKVGGGSQDRSQTFRQLQLEFASRVQASPAEQIAAARSGLDRQCELLVQDAGKFRSLAKNDQQRLAGKWKQALALAAEARIDVLGSSLHSSPAAAYVHLMSQIQLFREIEDDATRKQVLADARKAKQNWPTYFEEVHRDAWSSWADMKGALELMEIAEHTLDAKMRIPASLTLVSQQMGGILTRFELKPQASASRSSQETFDKMDEILRDLVEKPDIHAWQDSFSGEFAEVVTEASNFAVMAFPSLLGFGPKVATLYLQPKQRIQVMRSMELSQEKLDADETTFYAGSMARMVHMAQTLKTELREIDASLAGKAVADESQGSEGKSKATSDENLELRFQLQTLIQPLDIIESTASGFLSLLVPDITEEDFVKLARLAQAQEIETSSVADTDDIDTIRPPSPAPKPSVGTAFPDDAAEVETPSAADTDDIDTIRPPSPARKPSVGTAFPDDAAEAKTRPQATTFAEHLKSLRPPKMEDLVPEKAVDPITYQQMKAVVDPFLKKADENWNTALVALNNYHLAGFDRKKRQQLFGCSNELKLAADALTEARAAYDKALAEANQKSGVQRAFPLQEDMFMQKARLFKKAMRWVRNWADGPESLSFTERVKQGNLQPAFGKDSGYEGFCFDTSYGPTVEALAPQPPMTRWDGTKEDRDDIAFHFHFRVDPSLIPMSEVTKNMLSNMTVKQKGDRFDILREDQDGEMRHVPGLVLSQDDAWEVFKRVVRPEGKADGKARAV